MTLIVHLRRSPITEASLQARCARLSWATLVFGDGDLRFQRVPSGLGAARRPDCAEELAA